MSSIEEGITVAQAQFAKQLASNDKDERYDAVERLKTFLSKKKAMSEMELLKIWKGLFYCMWMSDKPVVQRELGDNLSALIHFVKSNDVPLFVKTYFDTMIREWGSIDHLRMDKYYYFMRAFLRNTLEYLYKHKYPKKTMNSLMEGLKSIWNDDGSSYEIILHLCDIWATEIFRACGSVAPNELLLAILEVFIHYYKYADHSAIEKRIQLRVFSTLFEAHFPDKPAIVPDLAKDRETYPDIYFSNLDLDSVAALLLKHASAKEEFYHRNGLFKAREQCLERLHSTADDLPTKRIRHSKSEAATYQRQQNEDFLDSMAEYYMDKRAADRQQRDEEEGIEDGDEEGEEGVNGGEGDDEVMEEAGEEEKQTKRSKKVKQKAPKKSADQTAPSEIDMEHTPANGATTEGAKSKKRNRRRKAKEAAKAGDTTTLPDQESETSSVPALDRKRKRNNNNGVSDNTNGAKQPLEEIEAKVANVPLDEVALNHTPGHHASFSHDMHKPAPLPADSTVDDSTTTSSTPSNGSKKKQAKAKEPVKNAVPLPDQPSTPKGKQEGEASASSPTTARKSVRWAKNQVKEFSSEITPTTPKSAPTQSKLKSLLTRRDSPAPRKPSSSRRNVVQSGL